LILAENQNYASGLLSNRLVGEMRPTKTWPAIAGATDWLKTAAS